MNLFDIKKDGIFIDLMVPNWKIGFIFGLIIIPHRVPVLPQLVKVA